MLSSRAERSQGHCVRTVVDPGHLRCGLAFTVDTYDAVCPFGCSYCYAKDVPTDSVTEETIERFGALLAEAFESDRRGPWPDALRKRVPIRVGFLRDPFPAYETKFKLTLRLLELLARYRYPCVLITKSDLVAQPPYLESLARPGVSVHISMTTLDEEVSSFIEPRAPAPRLRLQALTRLRQSQVQAFARVNPLMRQIKKGAQLRNCYTPELLESIRATGALGVVIGLLNAPIRASTRFKTVFPSESPESLRELQREAQAQCRAMGLPVSFCGIGVPSSIRVSECRETGLCCSWPSDLPPSRLSESERLSCSDLGAGRKILHRLFYSLISGIHGESGR